MYYLPLEFFSFIFSFFVLKFKLKFFLLCIICPSKKNKKFFFLYFSFKIKKKLFFCLIFVETRIHAPGLLKLVRPQSVRQHSPGDHRSNGQVHVQCAPIHGAQPETVQRLWVHNPRTLENCHRFVLCEGHEERQREGLRGGDRQWNLHGCGAEEQLPRARKRKDRLSTHEATRKSAKRTSGRVRQRFGQQNQNGGNCAVF